MKNKLTGEEQIKTGIGVMKDLIREIKTPSDKESLKQIKESVKVLEKKAKLLKSDEKLRVQYLDRTAFEAIQGVFQTLHLYIISTEDNKKTQASINKALAWLRGGETSYDLAARMQAAALARADFSGAKK